MPNPRYLETPVSRQEVENLKLEIRTVENKLKEAHIHAGGARPKSCTLDRRVTGPKFRPDIEILKQSLFNDVLDERDHRQRGHPSQATSSTPVAAPHKIDVLVSGRPSKYTASGTGPRSDVNMNIL